MARPRTLPDLPAESIVAEPVEVNGTDVLNFVRQEYKCSLNNDNRWSLFDKRSPDYAPTGSILTVHYKEVLTGQDTSFTGFMLALRRNVATPTMILRGEINGVGVEQVFNIFSPTITKIVVDKKATCLYGRKVYWIRKNPDWIPRFFTKPDEKVTFKKVKERNKILREQAVLEKTASEAKRAASKQTDEEKKTRTHA